MIFFFSLVFSSNLEQKLNKKQKQVVLGVVDPNPLVDGGGVSLLRAAGIEVVAIDGEEAKEAEELNPEFMRRMREGAEVAVAAKKKTVSKPVRRAT